MVTLNPEDLADDPTELAIALAHEVEDHAAEEGLRLEGPVSVSVETADTVQAGSIICHAEVVPGAQVVWARLIGDGATFEIGRNRAIVGRSTTSDTPVPYEDVSRQHALIWRKGGTPWVKDLGSANGTKVDGRRVSLTPMRLQSGSRISLASHEFRFKDQ